MRRNLNSATKLDRERGVMPSISTCPHCYGTILVASLANPDERLRCPLCQLTFAVEQVAAGSVPAPPMALPVVDDLSATPTPGVASDVSPIEPAVVALPGPFPIVEAGPFEPVVVDSPLIVSETSPFGTATGAAPFMSAAGEGAVEAAIESAVEAVAEPSVAPEAEVPVEVVSPSGEDVFAAEAIEDGAAVVESTPSESEPVEMATDETLARLPLPGGVPPWFDGLDWSLRRMPTAADESEVPPVLHFGAGDGVEPDEIAEADGEDGEPEETDAEAAGQALPSAYDAYRRRPQISSRTSALAIVYQMVGVVGGGIMGLALGYLILMWIGGPQKDFLNIRHKLPSFLVPSDNSGEAPAEPRHRTFADVRPMASGDPEEEPSLASGVKLASHNMPVAPRPVEALDVAGVMQPRRFTATSVEELSQVMQETGHWFGCELCNSTGFVKRAEVTTVKDAKGRPIEHRSEQRVRCDHCQGRSSSKLTPEVFQQLCRLAEAATFVRIVPGQDDVPQRREAIREMLLKAGRDRQRTEAIGRLAGQCLAGVSRQGNGIMLAGTVQEAAAEPFGHRLTVVLLGVPKQVHVYSQHAPQPTLEKGDRVLILGSIVDSPAVNLTGFLGTQPQVVWGGMAVRLDESK